MHPPLQPLNALIIAAVVLYAARTSDVAQLQRIRRTVQSVADDLARGDAAHANVLRLGRWRELSMMDGTATFATTTHPPQDVTFFARRVNATTPNADGTVAVLANNSVPPLCFFFASLRAAAFGQCAATLAGLRAWLKATFMFHPIREAEGLREESTAGRRVSGKSRASESSRPLWVAPGGGRS